MKNRNSIKRLKRNFSKGKSEWKDKTCNKINMNTKRMKQEKKKLLGK